MRLHYLDNIRWATVLLVLFYHVCYMFNGVGALGGIAGAKSLACFDAVLYFVYPWFMVLLFLIAGISARYALQKYSGREFIRLRVRKLLVPSTLGLFVLHWITGYLNIKMGGGLAYIPSFLIYPISAVSGIGPLRFIQMLFLFSCVLVLLRRIDRNDRVWLFCGRANAAVVLGLFLPLWGAAQIWNLPVLTMYRFGIYFFAFLAGYYVFSHNKVQCMVEKMHISMLAAAVVGGACYTAYYYGTDYTSPQCLQSLLTNVYLWAAVLAVLGCAKAWFDRQTPATRYFSASSFGYYILHYPVLIVTCYVLHTCFSLPAIWNYLIAFVVELGLTAVLYELLKRVPGLRYAVLGIRNSKR